MVVVLEFRPAESPTFSTESVGCSPSRKAATGQKQTVSTVMISPNRDTSKGLNDISGEPAVHAAL